MTVTTTSIALVPVQPVFTDAERLAFAGYRRLIREACTARGYALTDEMAGRITCPMLVTDPDDEQFWPGQSRELYDKLPAGKSLIRFTEEEGADSQRASRQRHPRRTHLRLARPAHPRLTAQLASASEHA